MTPKQLDKLAQLHDRIRNDEVYIGNYFQKMFFEELSEENKDQSTTEERRHTVERLYTYAKSHSMPTSLQSTLLLEILSLGLKINVFNEAYFNEYLTMPMTEIKGKKQHHSSCY